MLCAATEWLAPRAGFRYGQSKKFVATLVGLETPFSVASSDQFGTRTAYHAAPEGHLKTTVGSLKCRDFTYLGRAVMFGEQMEKGMLAFSV
jgi:hypothetical protein